MKPTLEPAGNLLVPVDETGTATGRPETLPESPLRSRLAELLQREPDPQCYPSLHQFWQGRVAELDHVIALEGAAVAMLRRLAREARMFRDYGHGREHLTNALIDAQRVLDGGAL